MSVCEPSLSAKENHAPCCRNRTHERPEAQWSSGVPGPQDFLCHNHLSLPSGINQSQMQRSGIWCKQRIMGKSWGTIHSEGLAGSSHYKPRQCPSASGPPRMQMFLCYTSHPGLDEFFYLEVHLWATFLRGDIWFMTFFTMILLDIFMCWRGSEVLRGLRVFNFIQVLSGNKQCMGICLCSCLFATRAEKNNLSQVATAAAAAGGGGGVCMCMHVSTCICVCLWRTGVDAECIS